MPTTKQKLVLGKIIEKHGNVYQAMVAVGYTHATALNPSNVLQSIGFQELLETELSDAKLLSSHRRILESKRIEHMVFPIATTDEEITELVESVNGTVRRFQHSETATHVWFWADNDKVRLDAIKLGYDIKGKLSKKDGGGDTGNTYNTFIQQNNLNPNAPEAKKLIDTTLEVLMKQTEEQ